LEQITVMPPCKISPHTTGWRWGQTPLNAILSSR
jgi:hypothetical protein